MRIKKFIGATSKEAVDKMREEFGEDAVILNTRRLTKGGLLGIGSGEYIEVTAAFDEAPMRIPSPQARPSTIMQPSSQAPIPDCRRLQVMMCLGGLRQLTSKFEEERKAKQSQAMPQISSSTAGSTKIESEIFKQELGEVKSALGEIAQHIKHSKMPILPETLKNAYTTLVENEVEEEIALEIVQTCNHKLSGVEIDDQLVVDVFISKSISNRILESPVRKVERKGYVIALVGPTGVGKTTTVAKLASISKLVKR